MKIFDTTLFQETLLTPLNVSLLSEIENSSNISSSTPWGIIFPSTTASSTTKSPTTQSSTTAAPVYSVLVNKFNNCYPDVTDSR